MSHPPDPTLTRLFDRIRAGDRAALDELLAAHRDVVHRFVELRMDPRLRKRVGVSDVVQETHLEVALRIHDFLAREPMAFRVWLLKTAHQQLLRLRRFHVEAARRSTEQEVPLSDNASLLLASRLAEQAHGPHQALARSETVHRVRAALADLSGVDLEVILLRTFEGLTNKEAAHVLDLEPDAASKRYTRALLRLRQSLADGA
ncbi:RNA polymerase sigma factor [Urbifossiella limnaea]|uniref:RNA polymerase sigma factor CnrH n=1 Tax=Urbifossiella limnaea TaxID=2528023 RepID=A0A517Y251_9BACT|nr:sigma-70 family RNA polymerase sigma factor [Urbifossiella limnaea]QDU23853.1 RNA polymerase sigma factor CnrH [Urbifossiella limnaea]